MKRHPLVKGLALIFALALLAYAIHTSPLGAYLDQNWIDAHVRNQGVLGVLGFVLVGGALSSVGVPRQLVAFMAGYAFGLAGGTLVGVATATTGCILGFTVSRLLGRGLLRERLGRHAARFDAFISAHPFSTTLLIRLLPTGSNFITNLAAGASSIRAPTFFAASALGYLPQTLVFALIGSGAQVAPAMRLALAVALFLASALIGVYLFRRVRRERGLPDAASLTHSPEHEHTPSQP